MTEESNAPVEAPRNDKEYNFRRQEQMYQRMLEEKEARIAALEKERESVTQADDEPTDEPYVDHKRLDKKLAKLSKQSKQETQSEIQKAIQEAIKEERKQSWLKHNADFQEVIKHADKLYEMDPEFGDSILAMPDPFERQKLAYKSIKALGLHQDKPKEQSIQDKVNANRRSPYYQPSGVGTSPYAASGDFSTTGQKSAYAKMQELKGRLGLSS